MSALTRTLEAVPTLPVWGAQESAVKEVWHKLEGNMYMAEALKCTSLKTIIASSESSKLKSKLH